MQMSAVNDQIAQVKGHFGVTQTDRVLIRFKYMFLSSDVELVVYLSDSEALGDRDPLHSIEVDRISPPQAGRPGAVPRISRPGLPGSPEWAEHEVWAEVLGLDLSQGTWVELVLEPLYDIQMLQPILFSAGGRGFSTSSVATSSVLIDDWGMEVHCDDSHCNDVTKDQHTDWQDFWVLKSAHGRKTGLPSGTTVSRCFEGGFCVDGYTDVYDHFSLDWIIENENRIGHLCGSLPPVSGWEALKTYSLGVMSISAMSIDLKNVVLPSGLMMLGKGYASGSYNDFIDHLYHLSSNQAYTLPYNYTNMRLIYGTDNKVYLLNSRDGLVDTAGDPLISEDSLISKEGQMVYLGVRWQGIKPIGLPLLDACVTADSIYVTPVIVEPTGSEPYAASARISRTSHQVEQLYYDSRWFDPNNLSNPYPYGLREIELDDAGNLYALNVHALNNSTMLWKYDSAGQVLFKVSGDDLGIADPLALHYCAMDQTLYVASGLLRSFDANDTTIYQLAEESGGFTSIPIAVPQIQHVTGMTSDDEGSLWIAGFSFEEPIPQEIHGNTTVDYGPKLVRIPLSRDIVEEMDLSNHGAGEVGYPTSVIWVD
jgi:hypothetical protein